MGAVSRSPPDDLFDLVEIVPRIDDVKRADAFKVDPLGRHATRENDADLRPVGVFWGRGGIEAHRKGLFRTQVVIRRKDDVGTS